LVLGARGTIPAKELKRSSVGVGDIIDFSFTKAKEATSAETKNHRSAKKILKDYKQDFDNLAKR